jgi:2-keto-4-pentenoate hydratase/2-oxohepta-3-ene-1,7-dioic acid hydratase in catechol pathway
MKALCFENTIKTNGTLKEPYFYIKPETTFLVKNRPFFIPEYSNDIRAQLFVAVRICKIGKYITEKFAFDYFNELTAGVCFTAIDLFNEQKAKDASPDISRNFDFSCPIGKFITKPEEVSFKNIEAKLTLNSAELVSFKIDDMSLNFRKMIVFASGFVSLKMGDIVMATTELGGSSVKIHDKLQVSINGNPFVNVEIK